MKSTSTFKKLQNIPAIFSFTVLSAAIHLLFVKDKSDVKNPGGFLTKCCLIFVLMVSILADSRAQTSPTMTCPSPQHHYATAASGACSAVINYTVVTGGNPTPTVQYKTSTDGSNYTAYMNGTGSGVAYPIGITYIQILTSNGYLPALSCIQIAHVSEAAPGTISGASAICKGSNTSYTSNGSTGGTWSSSNTTVASVNASTGQITGLSAGTASITYTVKGCANNDITSSKILSVSSIAVSSAQANVSCFGGNNGAISVSPSGGISPYTYLWNSGQNTQTISGLSAGSYSVTVTDAIGCTFTRAFTLTQPSAIQVAKSFQTNLTCFGGSNGAASINVPTGGEPGYTYDWTPGAPAGDGTMSVSGLSATSYTCTVTDANSCTASTTFTITGPAAIPAPGLVTATPSAICPGGTAQLNATSAGNNIGWFTAASGGSQIGTSLSGTNFAVTPAANTTYYAEAQNTCTSLSRTPVAVTITANNTWVGTSSSDWFTAANWSCGTVPVTTSNVIIVAGTTYPCIITGGLAQAHNLTIQSNATLTNNATLNINSGGVVSTAGIYKGIGLFTGAVYNNDNGRLSPGNSPGCTAFGSGYNNGSGTEVIEIGGTTVCTQYDQLQVTGTASLSGVLEVQLFGGYTPSCGDSYKIMTSTALTGTFSTINYPALPAGLTWGIQYNSPNIGDVTLNITGTPTVTATPASQTICSAEAITNIVLSGSPVGGTIYNWTRDNSGTVTGIAASGSGDISGTLTNTTNAPVTVTFVITPVSGNCTGGSISATVTVNPTPDVSQAEDQVVCNSANTAAIDFTGTVAGTNFNWTNTAASIGLAASGSGNIPSFIAVNTSNAPIISTVVVTPKTEILGSVTFNYSGSIETWTVPAGITSIVVTSTGAAGGAGNATTGLGASMTGTVSVTPGEIIKILVGEKGKSSSSSRHGGGGGTFVCRNNNAAIIIAGGGGGRGVFGTSDGGNGLTTTSGGNGGSSIGGSNGNGGAIGNFGGDSGCGSFGSGGGGLLTNGNLSNNGGGNSFLNNGNGGLQPSHVCIPAGFGGFGGGGAGGNGGGGGGGYSGGAGGDNGNGYPGGGGGGSINTGTNQIVNAGNTGNGLVTISYAEISCAGPSKTFTITVNPTPTATATPASQTVCSGAAITTIAFTGNVSGTVYNWTRDNTGVTGVATNGTGDITGTLTNTTNAPVTVTFTITPTYTDAGSTCTGTTITATVVVNPLPTIQATKVGAGDVCPGTNMVFDVTETSSVGGTFNWVARNSSNTILGSGNNVTYGPGAVNTNLGLTCPSNVTATFTFTPVAALAPFCQGTATSIEVDVRDLATPTWTTAAGSLNRSVECSDAAGIAAAQALIPAAVDNCDTDVSNVSKTSGSFVAGSTCAASGTYTNTFTVTDECGNISPIFSQVITITDNTAPILSTVPTQTLNVGASAGCTVAMPDYRSLVTVTECGSVTLQQLAPNAPGSLVIGYGGTRTIVIRATDACGNITNTSFSLNIVDATSPTVMCRNISVNLDPAGNASITATMLNNGSTDNCSAVTLVSVSKSVFDCSNVGANLVTLTVRDASGNTATCVSTVTVNDITAPVVSCFSDTTIAKGADCTNELPDLTFRVNATDACGIQSVTQSIPAGTIISGSISSIPLTLTITDVNGNTSNCMFTVFFTDQSAPVISGCPINIVVTSNAANPAACTQIATWIAPTAADNCWVSSFTSTHNSGEAFPLGLTTVTYTATDDAGNISTCSFTVTVIDNTAPVITGCPLNIVLTSTAGNTATCTQIATWTAPTATDNCAVSSFTSTHNAGDAFAVGTTTVTYTATDAAGNSTTCSFTVTVIDDTAPVITGCPSNIVLTSTAGNTATCTQIATWTAPTAADNCAVTSFTSTHNPGDAFAVGATTVTYTASDAAGNTTTCSFSVTVTDNTAPVITGCPSNIVLTSTAGNTASCTQVATWTAPTAADNCAVTSFTSTHNPDDAFAVGTTTVTYTAIDAAGNTTTCSFAVTVTDDTAPVISGCPSNIILTSNAGNTSTCTQVATWTAPTAADNCAVTSFTSTHNPGDAFAVGTTTVTYTAIDAAGNTMTCSFTVTVTDNTSPVITGCPSNLVITSNAGNTSTCTQAATWTAPTAADNCAVTSFTSTHNPGDAFAVGTTTVTYTAMDAAGNTTTCSFTVTVTDNTAPVISGCPSNIALTSNAGNTASCTQVATWTAPTAADNCAVSSFTSTHNPGDAFPVGTTTITYTATDAAGNTTTCSFTVTVTDDTAPVFTFCPSPILNATTNTAGCQATIATTNPTVTDNCAVTSLTWTITGATSGASAATGVNYVGTYAFNVGTTTITYTATDAGGNARNCVYTVSVVNNLAGSISGTSIVSQNSSNTSTIRFTGSGGTRPYTFTYNVSVDGGTPGATQTVSTTGSNSIVTVPQSNSVEGVYKYTLLSVTDALGCTGTLPAAPANAATITVVNGLPDFVTSIDIDALTFAAAGSARDFAVNISEIQNSPSVGQVIFRLTKLSAFDITWNAASGVSNVLGGTANNNSDWTITETGAFVTCTLKTTSTIPGFGNSVIGFRLIRKAGIANNTSQSITVAIQNNSGGDTNNSNNSVNASVTAQ